MVLHRRDGFGGLIERVTNDPELVLERNCLLTCEVIVFVIDPRPFRISANHEAFSALRVDLDRLERDLDDVPMVFQINRQDVHPLRAADLSPGLRVRTCEYVESVATTGIGTLEAFEAALRLAVLARSGG